MSLCRTVVVVRYLIRLLMIFEGLGLVLASSGGVDSPQQRSRSIDMNMPSVPSSSHAAVREVSVRSRKKRRQNNTGFYYGIRDDMMESSPERRRPASSRQKQYRPQKSGRVRSIMRDDSASALADIMGKTLLELREMREDIASLREEMNAMKRKMKKDTALARTLEDGAEMDDLSDGIGAGSFNDNRDGVVPDGNEQGVVGSFVSRMKRTREYDQIANDVEKWACNLLFEEGGEKDGWKEVQCNKFVRGKYNKDGKTKCYIKWMADSRGKHAKDDDDGREYPCIKCYSTIDAPMDQVCAYLARQEHMADYNDLVVANRDLEELSPHSKICWGQTPTILFVKPRDLVTFCCHRWWRDGTQVVINQACDHDDAPGVEEETEGKVCRAFALRGANFISEDPKDPGRTRFALLAHADPGGGLPPWACKTAVNAVAPIEPFKLFHNINEGISKVGQLPERTEVSSIPGRVNKPAGLSQLGYACFWPNGGGVKEGWVHPQHSHHEPGNGHDGVGPHIGRTDDVLEEKK